jgi:hypothetical protein
LKASFPAMVAQEKIPFDGDFFLAE